MNESFAVVSIGRKIAGAVAGVVVPHKTRGADLGSWTEAIVRARLHTYTGLFEE